LHRYRLTAVIIWEVPLENLLKSTLPATFAGICFVTINTFKVALAQNDFPRLLIYAIL
jgi:hypothetical protein